MLSVPPISYNDEFGEIDAGVFCDAQAIWGPCRILALKMINDEGMAEILMMKAVASVSEKVRDEALEILHQKSYLFKTFQNLIIAEGKKRSKHRELDELHFSALEEVFQGSASSEEERLCREILIAEIEAKMDEWTKGVYRMLVLGHTFEEMVPHFGKAANSIRAKYSRSLRKLAESIENK